MDEGCRQVERQKQRTRVSTHTTVVVQPGCTHERPGASASAESPCLPVQIEKNWAAESRREEILVHSVLGDNECFVRENPSTVTVGGENVRESYGLLAFNPRGPTLQSN